MRILIGAKVTFTMVYTASMTIFLVILGSEC